MTHPLPISAIAVPRRKGDPAAEQVPHVALQCFAQPINNLTLCVLSTSLKPSEGRPDVTRVDILLFERMRRPGGWDGSGGDGVVHHIRYLGDYDRKAGEWGERARSQVYDGTAVRP